MPTNNRILSVTKAVLNGDFEEAYKSLLTPDYGQAMQPGLYRGDILEQMNYRGGATASSGDGGSWVASIDGNGYNYFRYSGLTSATKAYTSCPELAAVINRKAGAYINGKTRVMNAEGQEAKGKYADQIRKLFSQPNILQSWYEFEAQNYIYTQIYGYCYVLAIKPFGYKNAIDASSLWNIPPSMTVMEETDKKWYNAQKVSDVVEKITITYKGEKTDLSLDDVFIIKDFTPSMNTMVLPESRIKALEMPVNNIIGAYESRNVLINYRGALGVISQDPGGNMGGSLPMTNEQKEALQKDFRRYGLRNRQVQFIITKASIKWQQMGYPTKELMLHEEVEGCTRAICDNYGFPFRLMANSNSNSLGGTDADIFSRNLYQDTVIPEAGRIYEQWERFFKLADYKIKLEKDYSHVPVLQENKVESGDARFRLNQALQIEWESDMITRNQWRVMNGDDPITGDDVYYSELAKTDQPLATTLGASGLTALTQVMTTPGLSPERMQAILEVIFGVKPEDAARLSVAPVETPAPATPTTTTPAPGAQAQAA